MAFPAPRPFPRTRAAEAFLERVEALALVAGLGAPGLNHWLAVACLHPFTARTFLLDVDVLDVNAAARGAIERGDPGPIVPVAEILAIAGRSAETRRDRSVRPWHLVRAVIERAGLPMTPETEEMLGEEARHIAPITSRIVRAAAPPIDDAVDVHPPPPGDVTPRRRSGGAGGSKTGANRAGEPGSKASAPWTRRTAPAGPVLFPTPVLDECATDLTAQAVAGRIGPVVGRDEELAQVIETLCRPTKANPMLVGEPGVGKSALVEGLAIRIAAGDVPPPLAGRRVLTLDMGALLRDTRWYGKLAERLGAIVAEAKAVRAILFIDESHQMIGGGGPEGSGDMATFLKPVLARGELSLIGATTDDEYRRIVVADGALERRFVVIRVQEPGRDALLAMIRAVRDHEAASRGVTVDDDALEHVLAIGATRMPHRREPDRSRDLLDQSIAAALSRGATTVDRSAVEAAADRLSGVPAVDGARITALEAELVSQGLLAPEDVAALAERLGLTMAGLDLRPERPRMVLLAVADEWPGADGGLAPVLAGHAFGAAGRVVTIDLASISEPSHLSGLIGTPQGYLGYGTGLPIHEIAQKPACVVRLRGIATCHPAVRALMAKAIRDGYLTDATGKRIHLSSAIVLLEARPAAAARVARPLGFGARGGERGGTSAASGEPGAGSPVSGAARLAGRPTLAATLLGDELAAEIDLVVVPPPVQAAAGHRQAARLVRELAARYRVAGVELRWDPGVERALADGAAGAATARGRERHVEEELGRVVRPYLRDSVRPVRVVVRSASTGLEAELDMPGA